MKITNFKVDNNEIQRTTPSPTRIVAGSVGTDAVQFQFDATVWADLTATAVFQAGGIEKSVLITDKTAAYEIPFEAMTTAGTCLRVGVFGVDAAGQVIVPTTYAKVCDSILAGANMDAEAPNAENENIYAQWVAAVANSAADASSAAQQANEDAALAQSAAQNAQECVDQAVLEVANKMPMISTDQYWMIWDEATDTYQNSGVYVVGAQGEQGEQGVQGDAFTYADFTAQQLADLKGEKGDKGDTGAQGDAFTYADFTAVQLAGLKGEKGDTGATGAKGEKGDTGDVGATGASGAQGAAFS